MAFEDKGGDTSLIEVVSVWNHMGRKPYGFETLCKEQTGGA